MQISRMVLKIIIYNLKKFSDFPKLTQLTAKFYNLTKY